MGQYGSTCSCLARKGKGDQCATPWYQIQKTCPLQRGDIILMSGTALISKVIKAGALVISGLNGKATEYSHIAIVVADGLMCEAIDNDDVKAADMNGDVHYKQVHVIPIEHRLFARVGYRPIYDKVAIRRLHGFEWTRERIARFEAAVVKMMGRPLNQSVRALTNVVFDLGANRPEVTCCEVIVEIYKATGLLPNSTNGRKTYPLSFAERSKDMVLLNGAALGQEIEIDLTK